MLPSPVDFYFDFISPYSFLASQRLHRYPAISTRVIYRPVVFGSMLSALGTKGPGEIPSRRRQGLVDLLLLGELYGIEVQGPPTHPFNSIYALRTVEAAGPEHKGALVQRLFSAAWSEGRALDDLDTLRSILAELNLPIDPEEAASDRAHRRALKANTKQLLELGGWGVPSFVYEGELLFGHDRLELLEALMRGQVRLDKGQLAELLARPQPGRIQ